MLMFSLQILLSPPSVLRYQPCPLCGLRFRSDCNGQSLQAHVRKVHLWGREARDGGGTGSIPANWFSTLDNHAIPTFAMYIHYDQYTQVFLWRKRKLLAWNLLLVCSCQTVFTNTKKCLNARVVYSGRITVFSISPKQSEGEWLCFIFPSSFFSVAVSSRDLSYNFFRNVTNKVLKSPLRWSLNAACSCFFLLPYPLQFLGVKQ